MGLSIIQRIRIYVLNYNLPGRGAQRKFSRMRQIHLKRFVTKVFFKLSRSESSESR